MDLAGLVTELEGQGAVTLALLRPDGTLEGGLLDAGGLRPLAPHTDQGLVALSASI